MDEVEHLMGGTEDKQVQLCPALMNYPLMRSLLQTRLWKFFAMYGGACYTAIIIFTLIYFNAYTSCPVFYGSADLCKYPIMFAYLIIFELVVNFAMFHYSVKYNRVDSILPASVISRYSENYRSSSRFIEDCTRLPLDGNGHGGGDAVKGYNPKYCYTCELVIPQRCHHCPLCQYCVMKKDHHCFITGGCVGYANQRYFIVFLFWGTVGSMYAMLYLFRYLAIAYQPFLPFGFIGYFLPTAFVKWIILGTITFRQLCAIILFNLGCMSTSGALVFFFMQLYLIQRNITMFERMKKQFDQSTRPSVLERLRYIFGPMFLLNFLVPLPFRNKMDDSLKEYVYELNTKEI